MSEHSRAHPRVCGENNTRDGELIPRKGSSPRVQGKRLHEIPARLVEGLIPACAGKTFVGVAASVDKRAHPRVCGENPNEISGRPPTVGSSPRVRGKRRPRSLPEGTAGLIPACAGKTCLRRGRAGSRRAHPRVCGENLGHFLTHYRDEGSSPRVRGKHERCCSSVHLPRLIPACAGKTPSSSMLPGANWAHPRVCGENAIGRSPVG